MQFLPFNEPFDLKLTLKCAQGHRWLRERKVPGWYSSIIDGQLVQIRQIGGLNGNMEFRSAANSQWIRDKLHWQFRLDDDLSLIYGELCRDEKMRALIEYYPGLRVMRVDSWECLAFFLLAVNTGIKPTHGRMEQIACTFAQGAALANGRYPFPKPVDLLANAPDGLTKLNRLRLGLEKGARLYQAAQDVNRSGEVTRQLMEKLYGAGPKTENCVALFSLGEPDAFPIDTHIREAWKWLYGLSCTSTRGQARFGKHAGYASQFLFIHRYETNLEWST